MIYNIDCIEGSKKLLPDRFADLIITDPPYNLRFGGTTQTRTKRPRFNIIANDNLSFHEYQKFSLRWLHEAYRILKPGRHIYVFIDWRMYPHMARWMSKIGFVIKNCIVWDKMQMGLGWQYRYQHEFIIFAVKGASKTRRIGTRSRTDIWKIRKLPASKMVHPTEKPADLMKEIILNSSQPGEMVVDFFLGSGPVTEAALMNDRELTGFEVDPHYYKLNVERIERLKGGDD